VGLWFFIRHGLGHAEATQKHDNIALTEIAISKCGRKTKARRNELQQANAGYYHSPEA
jgi:hypothetical protein